MIAAKIRIQELREGQHPHDRQQYDELTIDIPPRRSQNRPEVPVVVTAIDSPFENTEFVAPIVPPIKSQDHQTPSFSKVIGPRPISTGAISKVRKSVDPSELRIFVRNLRSATTAKQLGEYFGQWGEVVDVFIRKASYRGAHTNCAMAYITYSYYFNESPLSAAYVHTIDGVSVPVSLVHVHPNSSNDVEKSHTLMISGTIQDLADMDLIVYFSLYGKVSNVIRKVDPNNHGKYQRFAFIKFTETSPVDKAVEQRSHVVKGQIIDVRRVHDKK